MDREATLKPLRGLLAAAAFGWAAAVAAAEPPRNAALHELFEREFVNFIEESPELGTYYGLDGYDHRVTDLSPAAIARRNARIAKVKEELARFDPKTLNRQDRISREVFAERLEQSARELAFYKGLPFGPSDGWNRVSSMGGPHLTLPFVVRATRFRTAADYDNYLKRLSLLPTQLAQEIALMRAGMKSGWMPPREAMQRVPGMLDVFSGGDVSASPLWRPFAEYPAAVSAADREKYTAAGRKVLAESVHPAFAALKRFLEAEYIPASRKELGASTLPGGPAYYAHMMRSQTTTELDADEVHRIGLAEVARIRAEMAKVIAATGFKGTFAEFLEFVHKDKRFFFTRPEDRLRAYRDIAKRADAELPKLFAELPRMPYGIRAMEEFEGDNSDYYSGPALDGSRAGFFSANVNKLENRPSWEMEATLLHEAVPGHHLQTARAMELGELPRFRRAGGFTAYAEGWALYAESLGFDMGFYKDPYQHFGRLVLEQLRAVRLVIDTGLHAKGWTRDQAIRYFIDNGAGGADYAAAEVDRYIVLPGQALAYKIGELRIHALRKKAAGALGGKFDLRRFHNALLDDGALPLTVLEARIDEWIDNEKGKKP
jgi:uncharacterized protein (DUF885 family)